MNRIKRLSREVLAQHQSKFGEDFAENKKILNQISIIRSKGLKNELAGYITKFIKKELTNQKMKEDQAKQVSVVETRNEDVEVLEESVAESVEDSNEPEEKQATE